MSALERWHGLPAAEAEARLLACCGAKRWAAEVVAQRPFRDEKHLVETSVQAWFAAEAEDWLEAFACHPRIGERKIGESRIGEGKAETSVSLVSSGREQAEAQRTLDAVAEKLEEGNRLYQERFGFRYIVFASGRGAPELLAVLEERLTRTRDEELWEAARQQHRITSLRMQRWLETPV